LQWLKSKAGESIRGFTEGEAITILKAAKAEKDPVHHWIPLIAAYTGARLSEICQLRTKDIVELEGIPCFKFVGINKP
jgi:integrase